MRRSSSFVPAEREQLTLGDRIACACFGGMFGAMYGALLATVIAWMTDGRFQLDYVTYGAFAFAAIGLVLGPFVGDLCGGLLHFVYGLFAGIASGGSSTMVDPEPRATGWLRSLFLLGVGTGFTIYVVWYVNGSWA